MFQIKVEKKGEWDVITLAGHLDESAGVQLIGLYQHAAAKCRINLRDVAAVNSNGLRAWTLFIREFQQDRALELDECSEAALVQMNMLPSFIGKARVLSAYIPFECPDCETIQTSLVPAAEFEATRQGKKPVRCRTCQQPMQVVTPDDTFSFLATA